MLVDCVGTLVQLSPCDAQVPADRLGVLTILSGAKMPVRSAVSAACKWYDQYILSSEF